MKFGEDQERILSEVGEEILVALTAVAQAAQQALSEASDRISINSLANPSNLMVGRGNAERYIEAINSAAKENLRRLLREPFVARVEVDWGRDSVQTYYFSRPSAAGMMDAIKNAQLGKREGSIVKRTVFSPTQQDGLWL